MGVRVSSSIWLRESHAPISTGPWIHGIERPRAKHRTSVNAPLYSKYARAARSRGEAKGALAEELTAFHCAYSGVPRPWVHVVFQEYAPGNGYTAGKAAAATALTLLIRTGRSSSTSGDSSSAYGRSSRAPHAPRTIRWSSEFTKCRPARPWESGAAHARGGKLLGRPPGRDSGKWLTYVNREIVERSLHETGTVWRTWQLEKIRNDRRTRKAARSFAHVPDFKNRYLSDEALARHCIIDVNGLSVVEGPFRFGPPISSSGKIICVGLNYTDHAKEAGLPNTDRAAFLPERLFADGTK